MELSLSLKRSEIKGRESRETVVSMSGVKCKTEARHETSHQAKAKWSKENDQGQKM